MDQRGAPQMLNPALINPHERQMMWWKGWAWKEQRPPVGPYFIEIAAHEFVKSIRGLKQDQSKLFICTLSVLVYNLAPINKINIYFHWTDKIGVMSTSVQKEWHAVITI